MSKKKRKIKGGRRSKVERTPYLEGDEFPAFVPGNAPSPETLDEVTRRYQQSIRESPLWDEMVTEFGEEKAERLLTKFRVESR